MRYIRCFSIAYTELAECIQFSILLRGEVYAEDIPHQFRLTGKITIS